jgi:hypothetical protein
MCSLSFLSILENLTNFGVIWGADSLWDVSVFAAPQVHEPAPTICSEYAVMPVAISSQIKRMSVSVSLSKTNAVVHPIQGSTVTTGVACDSESS